MCLFEIHRNTETERERGEREGGEIILSQTKSHPEVKKVRDTNRGRSKKTARWKREKQACGEIEREGGESHTWTDTHTQRERKSAFEGWMDCFEVRMEETMAFSHEGGSPWGLPQNQPVWTQLSAGEGLQQARSKRAHALTTKTRRHLKLHNYNKIDLERCGLNADKDWK